MGKNKLCFHSQWIASPVSGINISRSSVTVEWIARSSNIHWSRASPECVCVWSCDLAPQFIQFLPCGRPVLHPALVLLQRVDSSAKGPSLKLLHWDPPTSPEPLTWLDFSFRKLPEPGCQGHFPLGEFDWAHWALLTCSLSHAEHRMEAWMWIRSS